MQFDTVLTDCAKVGTYGPCFYFVALRPADTILEEWMRRILLLLLLTPSALLQPDHSADAQPPPGYVSPSAPAPGAPLYAPNAGPSMSPEAFNTNNCGTPDEPKPCPPMPRHPLPYYPANKQ